MRLLKTRANCVSDGYQRSGDGLTCGDVNECEISSKSCDLRTSVCKNSVGEESPSLSSSFLLPPRFLSHPGSFKCICNSGFEKAPNGTCVDRDECSAKPGPCADPNSVCENLVASFACPCKRGFKVRCRAMSAERIAFDLCSLMLRATESGVLTSMSASIRIPTNATPLTEFAPTRREATDADAKPDSKSQPQAMRVLVSQGMKEIRE